MFAVALRSSWRRLRLPRPAAGRIAAYSDQPPKTWSGAGLRRPSPHPTPSQILQDEVDAMLAEQEEEDEEGYSLEEGEEGEEDSDLAEGQRQDDEDLGYVERRADLREPITNKAPSYRLHCQSTRTNTINTFTDPNGVIIAWFSGGSCGFRKRNRSTYEAGYQCAIRMFQKISMTAEAKKAAADAKKVVDEPLTIDLFVKGFGQGRDALLKALATAQGDDVRPRIVSITDRTPLKIGGTRAKKRKRR
ncbi:hypothetical protein HMN09_00517100 [Mycena chlorophos]|uniref:Mitochondrial ribosomal protein n=1 Tax=Mycena chlorophos TaxID=658473 RepID=A0A8H6WD99_MYCCL|nr:hypothetical protein HMN09_00517100 [Mycena chlorophos]